ncbi:transmembrane protein [Citrus sinensis]|uniref:Transmembrane protein n=1 Tax=Citrus sinensis TaxID=2711 RepID=A0ACB8HVA5_CITSI|nr:transmembrane protein [Citrus sinensis]
MYRSVSWSRVSDDMHTSQKPVSGVRTTSVSMDGTELWAHDPIEEIAKKEKSRAKFAENSVHFIPIVLLLCAFVLWLFSNPNVEVGIKAADSVAAKIDGLTTEGDIDTDSDGTQTSVLPMELRDTKKPKEEINKTWRKSLKRFK